MDRYAYVNNNPVMYTDPTGHFSEEKQLKKWFGKNWKDLFDDGWEAILLAGEFGDLVTYGNLQAVFVEQDGTLAGWNLDKRFTSSPIIGIIEMASGEPGELALYRPTGVNKDGGPTQNSYIFAFGEATSPYNAMDNGSQKYQRLIGDPQHTPATVELPLDWYMGYDKHVDVQCGLVGLNLGLADIFGVGGTTYAIHAAFKKAGEVTASVAAEGAGGPVGIAVLGISIVSWTTWDTSYTVQSGIGVPHIQPIPTP